MIVDVASLTHAHVALCAVENELRRAGRTEAANGLAIADLVVLNLRVFLHRTKRDRVELPKDGLACL